VNRSVQILADRFHRAATLYGNATAMIYHDQQRETTYSELNNYSNQVADGLCSLGLNKNERVGILDRNSDRFLEIILGVNKAGGTFMGINFLLSAAEVRFILEDSAATTLFVGAEFFQLIESIEGDLRALEHIIAIDGRHPRWINYDQWKLGCNGSGVQVDKHAESDIWQLYTSGTTGKPKGVRISEAAFSRAADTCMREFSQLDAGERQLVCLPMIHNFGLVNTLFGVTQGATSVITRKWDDAEVLRCLNHYEIALASFVPVMVKQLCAAADANDYRVTSLRRILYGGANISKELQLRARDVFKCELCQVYGMTENIGMSTCMPPGIDIDGNNLWSSVGAPYSDCEIKIVSETGGVAASGDTGEIIVRSPWLMSGYWNRPDATAETLVDGWLHTGDGGYLDDNGFLFLRDRIKDMIISGGENIYPAELENVIVKHPAVLEVCVVGVPDEHWGESPAAVVVPESGEHLQPEDLLEFLQGKLSKFKTPKQVVFRDSPLPRNATGKVLRREVREGLNPA
jgi:acyl-CoA synthetase (AMP-forming)/AMP-acid ligase II